MTFKYLASMLKLCIEALLVVQRDLTLTIKLQDLHSSIKKN